jgi:predicted HicB family RNase H-like nuclease
MTKDARERFTLRVPEHLFTEIKAMAKKQGVSANALILQILWGWVNDQAS